jgi:hypothetical protein
MWAAGRVGRGAGWEGAEREFIVPWGQEVRAMETALEVTGRMPVPLCLLRLGGQAEVRALRLRW